MALQLAPERLHPEISAWAKEVRDISSDRKYLRYFLPIILRIAMADELSNQLTGGLLAELMQLAADSPTLESISSISCSRLSDACLFTLAAHVRVKELVLRDCRYSSRSCRRLFANVYTFALRHFSFSLFFVDQCCRSITDAGLSTLLAACAESLVRLEVIRSPAITANGFLPIAQCRRLRSLRLTGFGFITELVRPSYTFPPRSLSLMHFLLV